MTNLSQREEHTRKEFERWLHSEQWDEVGYAPDLFTVWQAQSERIQTLHSLLVEARDVLHSVQLFMQATTDPLNLYGGKLWATYYAEEFNAALTSINAVLEKE